MRVYVSSHDRWAALHVAAQLSAAGHRVVSTWHDGPTSPMSYEDRARASIRQVSDAEALVLIASKSACLGGKFVEAGIALGQGKPVLILGRPENKLLYAPAVRAFDEPSQLVAALAG